MFQDKAGQPFCQTKQLCNPGTFEADSTLSGLDRCLLCPVHTYRLNLSALVCTDCPAGKYQDKPGSPVCDEVSNKDFVSIAANGDRREVKCPVPGLDPEFTCEEGQLKFTTAGFWHDGLPSSSTTGVFELALPIDGGTRFYNCPTKSNCAVNATSGAVTCMRNSAGVLCALCAPGYTTGSAVASGSGCSECPSSVMKVLWPWLLLAALAFTAAVVRFKLGAWKRWANFRLRVLKCRDMGLVVLFKLGIGFFQVVLLQPAVYDIRFPQLYLDFLAQFKFLEFGLPFQSFACFIPTD
jgi:hypothetical protein